MNPRFHEVDKTVNDYITTPIKSLIFILLIVNIK